MKNRIEITSDRKDLLYLPDETAVFTIAVYEKDKLASSGKLTVALSQDGGPGVYKVQTFDLSSDGNPVKVSAKLSEPCYCLCQVWFNGIYEERCCYYRTEDQAKDLHEHELYADMPLRVAADPVMKDPPRPKDFKSFWKTTLEKARALPDEMTLEKLEKYSRSDASYYRFRMNTLNGDHVYGFLGVPAGKGPFPMIALFPGKGAASVEPVDCGWTAAGCITLMFSVHKYPLPRTMEESRKQMDEYARSHGADDYWRVGIDHREKFHFYTVLPGFCRVLDHVCANYPWDKRHLVIAGSSQGGWMTLCMSALYRERVSAAYSGVPACGFFSRSPEDKFTKFRPPVYFEANYFAPEIKAKILVCAGLRDTSCKAGLINGMFGRIGSSCKKLETDNGQHIVTPQRYERERYFLVRELGLLDPKPVRVPPFTNELIATRGDMLHKYYVNRFRAIDREREKRLAQIKTRSDAEGYARDVREKIRKCFGPIPEVKVIDPLITGQIFTEKLQIDKVLFQSREGFYVSGLFYRPKVLNQKKMPAVLFLCGHSADGKNQPTYQRACQKLALQGFCVFVPDPYGQGDRVEHGGGASTEHNRFGQRLAMLGEFLGAWMVHDSLTALEYLKSRPEVDVDRIGVTGCSGGGTMTSYINTFAPDLIMAAPVCSMTRLTSNLENEVTGDCEQNPPSFRLEGLDEDDFFLAQAPRPVLLGVQDNDFFDPRGTRKMYESLRSVYKLFGKEDSVVYSSGKGLHGYPVFHQQAVADFFAGIAHAQSVGNDEDIHIFSREELYCTEGGSVWKLPGAMTTQQILKDLFEKKLDNGLSPLTEALPESLDFSRIDVPTYRIGKNQYISSVPIQAKRFLIRTEEGIEVTLKVFGEKLNDIDNKFPDSLEQAVIYLPEQDGVREMDLRDHKENKKGFFVLEVRGCGESRPFGMESDLGFIGKNLCAISSRMLGEEFVHKQIWDILAVLKLMKMNGLKEATLIANRNMYFAASAAAKASPIPVRVKVDTPPVSVEKYLFDPQMELSPEYFFFGQENI